MSTETTPPHDGSFEVYDEIYERTFGDFYEDFTARTLDLVRRYAGRGARILDLGAGTGRLAVPLARDGFAVTAVEPCPGMLGVLERKAERDGLQIELANVPMADFRGDGRFDVALCVFTVVSYILDEESLERSFRAVRQSLRTGGRFLLDVPASEVFQSTTVRKARIRRSVTISPRGDGVFSFSDEGTLIDGGLERHFGPESFDIRSWTVDQVAQAVHRAGFQGWDDVTDGLASSGAEYFITVA